MKPTLFTRSLLQLSLAMLCLTSNSIADQPNILFLFADDMSYEAIGAAEMLDVETPNLDRLAKRGTQFSHAYNMGSWSGAVCVASRTMLNTGRFIWRAHATDLGQCVNDKQMWSQKMREAGYQTYMSGKWHVATDTRPLFDVVKNVRAGMPRQTPAGYNRPNSEADYASGWKPWDPENGGYWEGGQHWSEALADDGIEYLNQAAGDDPPFFMYLAFNAPHDPRQSPKEYVDRYPLDRVQLPEDLLPEYPYADAICGKGLRDEKLMPYPRTEYAVKVNRQEYFALITHMDDQIGRILDALEKTGKSDNTYIFFTADHGLAVGHHGLVGKQNMYDHSVRVPFIAVGPNIKADTKIETPIYLQDVMPTSLELAGMMQPADVDFKSLLPLLREETTSHYEAIYGAYLRTQRMISQDGWKLIRYPTIGISRLYNLNNDPHEMRDLVANSQHAEKGLELTALLEKKMDELEDPLPTLDQDNQLSDQEKKNGWQLLFNGTDLTGWKCNNGKDLATPVENGSIVPYKSGGYLVLHEQTFDNFILKCDVKWDDPNCNSGIFFRVEDPENPVHTGLEVQVMSGANIGKHQFGAIYDLVSTTKNNGNATGEWNSVEIKCDGPHINVKVNGEEVAAMDCDQFDKPGLCPDGTKHKYELNQKPRAVKNFARKGQLGFQDHGHKVWYKNVKLKELDVEKKPRSKTIEPTHRDVSYGAHEANVIDFYEAEGDGPRPLLVYIHGGGWVGGDKEQNPERFLPFIEQGISYAAINYRLSGEAPLPAPVHDAARAIQFLRSKATEWNIDQSRIALTGGSAGACTSMWILLHDDLADPNSDDPVLRQSTRVSAAAVAGGQTSIDPKQIEEWLGPNVLKHRMINMAVGEATMEGVWENYEKHQALYQEFSPYNHLDENDPPLMMTYGNNMTLPSENAGHGIHHPVYGMKMMEKAKATGHECHLLIKGVSDSEKYSSPNEFLMSKLLDR